MYAEIRITVIDGLSSSLHRQAAEWFAPTVLPSAALERAEFALDPEQLAQLVLAKRFPTHSTVIIRDDQATLRVFAQLAPGKQTLASLKDAAEETAGGMSRFLQAHGMTVASARIRIYAEGEYIETGREPTWWERFVGAARKETAGRLSAPVATFLVSLALDSDVSKAATSAAAAFAGVIVWLLVSTTLEKPGYRYE